MAAVHMHIEKFGGVVKIDDHHPLAVAQRERDAAKAATAAEPAAEPTPELTPEPVVAEPTPAAKPRKRGRPRKARGSRSS